ncbi:hypothetical protein [Fodinicola feengrottensis]|uniref:hypothetical protein n=1 Tax=Fodinicola feengrottensis TaxID=435914 RepID=UPI0024415882|nr:hypothetical protein [Fodinicola feengrottensis]
MVVVLRLTGVMAVPDYTPRCCVGPTCGTCWFSSRGSFLWAFSWPSPRSSTYDCSAASPSPPVGGFCAAVSAILVLGGLVVVLYGVYTFSPLTFLGYGPALMGVGLGVAIWAGLRRRDDRLGWEIAEV